jgi:capsular exopolysaccharide synthesis family protein
LIFFLEYLDNTIKSPEDVEQYLDVPLLGVLEKVKVQDGGKSTASELITHEMPKSVFAEAARNIRTGVMFSFADKPRKLILITSTTQGEGKTFVASNLATAIAQTGKNTLLVDTDFRKPRINKIFNITKNPGLSNHLIGETDFESIIKSTCVPNLSIATCGFILPNPSEMLGSTNMEEFCKTVKERFDMVIFDSPPVMTVTDAIVLSGIMDGLIIVIKSGETVRETAKRAISQLTGNRCEILGAVVNYVDISIGSYYYQYYSHYYKYGYDSEEDLKETEKI